MMRYFNTSGPCDPDRHYTVMRETLIAKGQSLVEQGRYFTIFAPRQAGKTTYFQLLFRQLRQTGYTPIWISFEGLKTLPRSRFYYALNHQLQRELVQLQLTPGVVITDQLDLELLLEKLQTQTSPIVLVIDEFEDVPAEVMGELMHLFRRLYQQRQYHGLQSLILVGVSTIAELVVSSASPFNVVDELRIPYFSFAEIQDLIQQYVSESGQVIETPVVKAIYDNTRGQPGLVCALCQYLVEEVVTDRNQAVAMPHFYATLKHFLTERFDKNILNIVQKAREKQAFMMQLLFNEQPVPFTVDDPDIAYLYAHGVVDNVNGYVEMPVPLYSKRLITAFRPLINGESPYYVSTQEVVGDYVTAKGLNIKAMLAKYREYVRRRGFKAFDTKQLKEAVWHYSLDGFINFFIERLGGETFVEVPTGRGRTDILILYQGQRYIVETKIFTDQSYFVKGKRQLAAYLKSEGLSEGYYVVFSNKHIETDPLYFEEEIDGKWVYTYIIRTDFEQPSR
jgi:hypothetical protein